MLPRQSVSLHACKRRSFLRLSGSSHANTISIRSPNSRVSMTTRSYHAEIIDQAAKAIPGVLHTRPHDAVNSLCCVGRPLHHRSCFGNISSLCFGRGEGMISLQISLSLESVVFFFVSLCFNKGSFLKQRSNKRKERAHQPSRSSEGWKGVDAEHNDVRGERENGETQRE